MPESENTNTYVPLDVEIEKEELLNCTNIFRDIMRLKHELTSLANKSAASLGLKGSEMAIIDTLGTYGPLSMSDLATACFFSPPNATYTVRALEKRNLLKRVRSVDSQRVVIVHLTPEGEEMFKRNYPRTIQDVSKFLSSNLSGKERKALQGLLHKLSA